MYIRRETMNEQYGYVPKRVKKGFGAVSWIFTAIIILICVATAVDMTLRNVMASDATASKICGYIEKYFLRYIYNERAILSTAMADFPSVIRIVLCGLSIIFATVQLARYPRRAFGKCAFAFSFIFITALVVFKHYLVYKYLYYFVAV